MPENPHPIDQAVIDAILFPLSPQEHEIVRIASGDAADDLAHRFHAHRARIDLHLRPSFDAITAYLIAGWVHGLRAELEKSK